MMKLMLSLNKLYAHLSRRGRAVWYRLARYLPHFTRTLWFKTATSVVLIVVSTLTINLYIQNNRYNLSPQQKALASTSSIDTNYIKQTKTSFTYDRSDEQSPKDKQQELTIDSAQDATGKTLYTASLPKDPKQPITFGDQKGERGFSLTNLNELSEGRLEQGSVIYPSGASQKHIYSYKKNGIKQDIIITSKPKDKVLTFSWKLNTGKDLEAKMMPSGGVGIYSASPYLFGDITVSDEKSQKLIDNAKTNGTKDFLLFTIPTPFILDSKGTKTYDDVSFTLKGNILTLEARNMQNKTYPLNIDPTITVTTTSDFRQATGDTGNIDYGIIDEIRRGTFSSGEAGTWATDASSYFAYQRSYHTSVAYNGYIYVMGGQRGSSATTCKDAGTNTSCNDVQYAPINADGTLGTWATDASSYFAFPRYKHTSIAYNGYMYVMGGLQIASATTCKDAGTNVYCNDVQYAPINADGTLGTWATDASSYFAFPRYSHTTVAYNGYMYVMGGFQSTSATTCKDAGTNTFCNDVQYAAINADGSLGTFTTDATSYFAFPRGIHTSVAYNGYMYVMGGAQATSDTNCKDAGSNGYCNDVQYAAINADGSLGTFTTSATSYFAFPRYSHTSVAYNGYMYVTGGFVPSSVTTCKNAGTNQYCNDVQYAAINADGSLGTFTTDTTSYFAFPRSNHTSVAYNGYMYVIGGGQPTSDTNCKDAGTSFDCNDVQYAQFRTSGSGAATTDASSYFAFPRRNLSTVAYNGYMYVIGGEKDTADTNCKNAGTVVDCNDVQYAPINADGTLGIWTTDVTSYFAFPRRSHKSIAYNGYMYVMGGTTSTSDTNCKDAGTNNYCNDVQYAPINADGTLGIWTTDVTSYFAFPRDRHTTVAYNGFLYLIGGRVAASVTTCKDAGTSQYCNDVQYAPINADGTLGIWTTDASSYFSIPRMFHTTVAHNGFMYVMGGLTGVSDTSCKDAGTNTACNDVQYTPINADGTLGTWATDASSYFAFPRYSHISVSSNGYMYIIGGFQASSDTNCKDAGINNYCNDVQYAPINADGTLGTWTTDASSYFAFPRYLFAGIDYNGYLYIMGGFQSSSATTCKDAGTSQYCNDVQYLRIGQSGGVETSFTTDASSYYAFPRDDHTSVAYNGYMYVIGGLQAVSDTNCKDAGTNLYCNDVQYAAINADGSLGTWTTDTSSYFATPRDAHTSVVYNGYLYIMGGIAAGVFQNDVQYAQINADGSLGTWTTDTSSSFAFPRDDHTSVVYNGYMYVLGGRHATNDTNCKNAGTSLTCNDVQYAQINADGSLGTWTTDTTSYFAIPRQALTSVVYNGYMYVIGGYTNLLDTTCKDTGSNRYCNDVQYAQINADGSLGTWTTDASSYFAYPRGSHTSVAYNGYMYVMGGTHFASGTLCKNTGLNNTDCNDVQYAQINADGSLNTWTTDGSSYFSFPRSNPTSVAYNGYMYVMGGYIGLNNTTCKNAGTNAYCNDVQYAPLTGIMQKARYERTIDTTMSGNDLTSFTIAGTAKCSYTVTYKTAGSSNIYGATTTLINVYPGVSQAITVADTRYVSFVATLDDSTCGGQSIITSISLLYNAAPDTPTLILPSANATAVPILPEFRLGSSDESNDYLRYRIEVCSTSNCSSIVRTIDQTLSQTGWIGQSTQTGTAYTGGLPLTQVAIHQYQTPALTASTQYWWRGYARDPGGSDQLSNASAISTFTTGVATPSNVNIGGGTTIYGGTNFSTN